MSNVEQIEAIIFFQNPSRTQLVTFSLGQIGCDYLKCDFQKWGQY